MWVALWKKDMSKTDEFRQPAADITPPPLKPSPETPYGLGRLLRLGLIVVLAAVAFGWTWRMRIQPKLSELPPLGVLATVPDFSLMERDGRTVTRRDLLGSVWIADFIFTRCAGPCPVLSLRMRSLQESIAKYDGKVKVVSFSVDPTYDQPPILRSYAEKHQADPKLWWFLTCDDEAAMHSLVQNGFLQTVVPGTNTSPITHTTYFVLVGRKGRIRAYYDGLEADSKPLILRDVERLLNEPTG